MNIKNIIQITSLFILLIVGNNSFADSLTTKSIEVEAFSRIENHTAGSIELIQGPETKLIVETEADLFDQLKIKIKGDTLILASEKGKGFFNSHSPFNNKPLHFTITTPKIEAISLHASGDLASKEIESDRLTLAIHGSGKMKIDAIDAEYLSASINGSGSIKTNQIANEHLQVAIHGSGEADLGKVSSIDTEMAIHGSGDIDIRELSGEELEVNIYGSGDIQMPQVDLVKIAGSIHGSGDIRLGGRAKSLEVRVHGSGDVNTAGFAADRIIIR